MDSQRKALAAAAAGGTGAVLTTVLFYPVELVKNRLQSSVRGDATGFVYNGLSDGLLSVLREEGVTGLFVGIRPVVLRALTSDFATVWFGELLVAHCRSLGAILELPLRIVGGWGSVALTLPLETISTRVTCTRPPLSVRAASLQLWREGGVLAFWRGFRVMLVLCVNPALTFTAFGWLRALFRALSRAWHSRKDEEEDPLTWVQAFGIGAAAKLITLCLVYPLIRAKFLLQAGTGKGNGLFQVLRSVAVEEGVGGLYRGLDAQLSKSLLSTALMLAVKERTEEHWRRLLLRDEPRGKQALKDDGERKVAAPDPAAGG